MYLEMKMTAVNFTIVSHTVCILSGSGLRKKTKNGFFILLANLGISMREYVERGEIL